MEQLVMQLAFNTMACFAAIGFAEMLLRWRNA